MGSKSAPEYAKTTFDTGNLFGKATNDKSGTTFTPTGWETQTMNVVSGGIPSTLSSMLTNDFTKDANFKAYQNDLNRQMTQAYDTDVLSQLANRGLMRSSALQNASNAFADTLAKNEMNLYDNYYNRLQNNYNNLWNSANSIFNYITGINNGALATSNAVNKHNMDAYTAQQNANSNLFGTLANAAGSIAAAPITGGGSIAGNLASKLI